MAGAVESLNITSHDATPPRAGFVAISGGLSHDMAIHDLDMARWLPGEALSEVGRRAARWRGLARRGRGSAGSRLGLATQWRKMAENGGKWRDLAKDRKGRGERR